ERSFQRLSFIKHFIDLFEDEPTLFGKTSV
ncbi:hypothetical protein A2U01_0035134, partial [Trifolium medium]|nr:hypothetical protein [Trifolium medium]